jgi:hypothetical protein
VFLEELAAADIAGGEEILGGRGSTGFGSTITQRHRGPSFLRDIFTFPIVDHQSSRNKVLYFCAPFQVAAFGVKPAGMTNPTAASTGS